MNDAGEVLLTIFVRVMNVSPAAAAALDATFGLSVSEHVQCSACCKVTQQSSHMQCFYNTQVCTCRRHTYRFSKQHWSCMPELHPSPAHIHTRYWRLPCCGPGCAGSGAAGHPLAYSLPCPGQPPQTH